MSHIIQRIAIDNQKVIEAVTYTGKLDGDPDDTHTVLSFEGTNELLNTWRDLDPAHRDFRYGRDDSDSEPATIVIAWVDANGNLEIGDVDPFWNGLGEENAYSLDVLSGNIGCPLEWEPATT